MHKEMQAAVIVAPGQARVDLVPVPEPGPGEVRVKLQGCGVCGSNLPPWEGRDWFTYPLKPGELGHEGWGLIDAVGTDVRGVVEGDRVALLSYHAYAQYDVAPQDAIVKLPRGLDAQPFPGEALGCAMNVFKRCDIWPDHTVAVVGAGFLGSVLISLAARAGAEVIAISRRPFALQMAKRFGAAHVVPIVETGKHLETVRQLTKGRGCDRVIEATGQQEPLNIAGEITAERGRLIIAGYHQDGLRQVNMQLWNWKGIDVINAHERDPAVYREGIRSAVEAVEKGLVRPMPLYTHTFALQNLSNALNAIKERPPNFMKALITL